MLPDNPLYSLSTNGINSNFMLGQHRNVVNKYNVRLTFKNQIQVVRSDSAPIIM